MSEDRPAKELEKIMIRLPDGMRDRLAAAAKENKRSTNAEVVARLEESFVAMGFADSLSEIPPEEMIAEVQRVSSIMIDAMEALRARYPKYIEAKEAVDAKKALNPKTDARPRGPATDAVKQMDKAIEKDRAKPKRAR